MEYTINNLSNATMVLEQLLDSDIEVLEEYKNRVIIESESYNLLFALDENNAWDFLEAFGLVDNFATINPQKNLFNASDILSLIEAIKLDKEKLWKKYFRYENGILKSTDKQYLLDYIEFIKRITN